MNFFKRATISILRRPGKTVILLVLVFILGTIIAGAISVRGAINNTDANLRSRMQPIVSVSFDAVAWEESIDWSTVGEDENIWLQQPHLMPSHVREIAELPYVSFYDYMIVSSLQSFEVEQYIPDELDIHFGGMEGEPQWFNLRGTSSTELVQIDQGMIDLVQGDQFDANELIPGADRSVAIVSTGFANANNLSLNSTFTLYNFVMFPDEQGEIWGWGADWWVDENIYERVGMEFEIIGLFDIPIDSDQDQDQGQGRVSNDDWQRMDNLNNIYVPNWAIEDVARRTLAAQISVFNTVDVDMPEWLAQAPGANEDEEHQVLSLFVLEDPAYMDEFRAAAEPLLPEYHSVEDLSSAFDDIASSMETMQTLANGILYVSIGATLLILSLLITLFLRDRRYEMGVYLALGEKKGRIVSQILMEVVVTALVGITLAVFTGHFMSGLISQNMLREELAAQANQNDDEWHWTVFDQLGIPTDDMSIDDMMAAYDISLSIEVVGFFYVIGLGAVVLSTLAPVIYVMALNPKKVLM